MTSVTDADADDAAAEPSAHYSLLLTQRSTLHCPRRSALPLLTQYNAGAQNNMPFGRGRTYFRYENENNNEKITPFLFIKTKTKTISFQKTKTK